MENIQNNKSPEKDELIIKFYKDFESEIKKLFLASETEAK